MSSFGGWEQVKSVTPLFYFIFILKFFKCYKSFQEFLRPEFQMLSYPICGKCLKSFHLD